MSSERSSWWLGSGCRSIAPSSRLPGSTDGQPPHPGAQRSCRLPTRSSRSSTAATGRSASVTIAGHFSGSSARMLQRSKSLPHLVELAECRMELARISAICDFLLGFALVAAAKEHGQQSTDHTQRNQSPDDHFWTSHWTDGSILGPAVVHWSRVQSHCWPLRGFAAATRREC